MLLNLSNQCVSKEFFMSNPEQISHEYPTSYITSSDLAVEMAYAEYPYRLTAQEASKNGLAEEATRLGYLANIKGVMAGEVYLETLQDQLRAGTGEETLITTPEVLTPQEQAYKETALERFAVSNNSYRSYMHAMNKHKSPEDKLVVVGSERAKTALEAILTPAMIRAEMAQVAEFTANPIENSPEAGFDTVFIPNADLTDRDETVLANHLQGKLRAYKGKDGAYVYPALHNSDTAHTATSADANVVAVRVPRHLNVAKGVGTNEITAVQDQANQVNAHNNDPNTSYKLEMASDMVALAHIALLIDTQAIDTTNPNYNAKRFWATYYKNVLQAPVDGCVSGVYVGVDGQLRRDRSDVDYDNPSRALVVPKLES